MGKGNRQKKGKNDGRKKGKMGFQAIKRRYCHTFKYLINKTEVVTGSHFSAILISGLFFGKWPSMVLFLVVFSKMNNFLLQIYLGLLASKFERVSESTYPWFETTQGKKMSHAVLWAQVRRVL